MRLYQVAGLFLTSVLVSASAVAGTPKADAVSRVSSGITAPVLADPAGIYIPAGALNLAAPGAKVVLALNVDEKGNAQNVRIVQSAGPQIDARVVTAVMQSHFHPATLNKQAIPVEMALTVNVVR